MFCHVNRQIISVKIGLFFHEITFIIEFPDSNFLLPTFLTGGKWDFPVANLLLATVTCNFEPSIIYNYQILRFHITLDSVTMAETKIIGAK